MDVQYEYFYGLRPGNNSFLEDGQGRFQIDTVDYRKGKTNRHTYLSTSSYAVFDGILAQSTAHISLVSATMEGNWTRPTTAVHFSRMSSDSSRHIIYTVAYKNSITMVMMILSQIAIVQGNKVGIKATEAGFYRMSDPYVLNDKISKNIGRYDVRLALQQVIAMVCLVYTMLKLRCLLQSS